MQASIKRICGQLIVMKQTALWPTDDDETDLRPTDCYETALWLHPDPPPPERPSESMPFRQSSVHFEIVFFVFFVHFPSFSYL